MQNSMLILNTPWTQTLLAPLRQLFPQAEVVSAWPDRMGASYVSAETALTLELDAPEMTIQAGARRYRCKLLGLVIADGSASDPVSELVLIGEGPALLEQALAMAGRFPNITILRRRSSAAFKRVIQHYLSRMRNARQRHDRLAAS
jgi:hypothetical protein